jgi:hypothetical protein
MAMKEDIDIPDSKRPLHDTGVALPFSPASSTSCRQRSRRSNGTPAGRSLRNRKSEPRGGKPELARKRNDQGSKSSASIFIYRIDDGI